MYKTLASSFVFYLAIALAASVGIAVVASQVIQLEYRARDLPDLKEDPVNYDRNGGRFWQISKTPFVEYLVVEMDPWREERVYRLVADPSMGHFGIVRGLVSKTAGQELEVPPWSILHEYERQSPKSGWPQFEIWEEEVYGWPVPCLRRVRITAEVGESLDHDLGWGVYSIDIRDNLLHSKIALPVSIIPSRLLSCVVLWLLIILSLRVLLFYLLATVRTIRRRCIKCGYNLAYCETPGCPECGWNRPANTPDANQERERTAT